jgi:LysM repeat protein
MRRLIVIILTLLALTLMLGGTVLAQQSGTYHVVSPGENLFRISLRYNVSMAAIANANGIVNYNLIYAGQRLLIPTGGTGPGPVPTTPPPGQCQPGQGSTYTVVRGDTLGNIARRFGTTVQAIAQANGITNINLIFVGQRLNIPGGSCVPGTSTPPPGGGTPQPISGFEVGGHVFSFAYPSQMRGAGMTWAKSQVRWSQGQPASIAQGAINAARNNGFKVMLGIVGNPQELAANPSAYYQNFATFLGDVARLNPDAIEVWNEQNIDREWPAGQINPANYTQMLQAAYQAIKAANPNVLVISGAPAPTGFFSGRCTNNGCDDDAYIRGMAQAGAANSMDCVGIHYNEGILSPTQRSGDPRGNGGHYTRYFFGMLDLYSSVFPSKPLCFTEIGYLSPEGFGPLPEAFNWAANTSVAEQAEWLSQAVILARDSRRVRLFIVWNVDSTTYGADPQAGYAIVRNNQCLACITMGAALGVQQ